MQRAGAYSDFKLLGQTTLSRTELKSVTMFLGAMYGKQNCISLNEIRCEKASKNTRCKKLPPTDDSFKLHTCIKGYGEMPLLVITTYQMF